VVVALVAATADTKSPRNLPLLLTPLAQRFMTPIAPTPRRCSSWGGLSPHGVQQPLLALPRMVLKPGVRGETAACQKYRITETAICRQHGWRFNEGMGMSSSVTHQVTTSSSAAARWPVNGATLDARQPAVGQHHGTLPSTRADAKRFPKTALCRR
jgi:hypothetical protein